MLLVVKYGGNAMGGSPELDPVLADCAAFAAAGGSLVLVHGGGPQIDAALRLRGVDSVRVAGLRVTDPVTLEVTEQVLCGSVNKALVRLLLTHGVRAVGLSGQDGGSVRARLQRGPHGEDLGFVGMVSAVDPGPLQALLHAGFTPVVAPVALDESGAGALNVNADETAGAIAGALRADAYIAVTNVDRVRRAVDRPETAIDRIDRVDAQAYINDGTFDGGIRPKILSAVEALGGGAKRALICGAKPNAISLALDGDATEIV
jgi:acetylglutamate kinase